MPYEWTLWDVIKHDGPRASSSQCDLPPAAIIECHFLQIPLNQLGFVFGGKVTSDLPPRMVPLLELVLSGYALQDLDISLLASLPWVYQSC